MNTTPPGSQPRDARGAPEACTPCPPGEPSPVLQPIRWTRIGVATVETYGGQAVLQAAFDATNMKG